MNRVIWLAIVVLAGIGLTPLLPHTASSAADPPSMKSKAEGVASDWAPKKHRVGDLHEAGAAAPKDGPTNVVVSSFSTTEATFEELWNYYAEKSGTGRRYKEKEFSVGSGEGKHGSYVIVDRLPEQNSRETVFCLRTKEYTVTVTLRPASVGKAVLGTVTVVAH